MIVQREVVITSDNMMLMSILTITKVAETKFVRVWVEQ